MQLGMLFHANMPFSWAFETAYYSCYQPLPQLMQVFPDLQFNWHWGAPLLQMLQWRYPTTIEDIKNGIQTDQYEILGSAYAQNVMIATSTWANQKHIELNREVIAEILEVTPKGFWNPERVWIDDFGDLLLANSYQYTLLENTILDNNMDVANKLWHKQYSKGKLTFLPDNQKLIWYFNELLWSGDSSKFFNYIEQEADSGRKVFCYADDAEASGFWQLGRNLSPHIAHKNLEAFFRELVDQSWINVTTFSTILESESSYAAPNELRGQASWMKESARFDGYHDYFDFLDHAPELQFFSEMFNRIEQRLQTTKLPKSSSIYQSLELNYLSHQFEFACTPGSFGTDETRYLLNVPGTMLLGGAEQTLHILDILEEYESSNESEMPIWITYANEKCILWISKSFISIWSQIGGRCVFLYARKYQMLLLPNLMLNNMSHHFRDITQSNPGYVFRHPELFSVPTHFDLTSFGFEDELIVDGVPLGQLAVTYRDVELNSPDNQYDRSLKHTYYSSQILPFLPEVKFYSKHEKVVLFKHVTVSDTEIMVKYRLKNLTEVPLIIELITGIYLSPQQETLLSKSKSFLKSVKSEDHKELQISSQDKKYNISLKATNASLQDESANVLFASKSNIYVEEEILAKDTYEIEVKLSVFE